MSATVTDDGLGHVLDTRPAEALPRKSLKSLQLCDPIDEGAATQLYTVYLS